MKAVAGAALGSLAVVGSAYAADPQSVPQNFQSLVFLRGTCERLETPGIDLTSNCRGTVVNMIYRNGRSSFAFSDGDRAMVSFSGMGQTVNGDFASQPIDHVSIATDNGRSVKSEDASGSCEFSNAYAGRSFVRCKAKAGSGDFFASFSTDGSAPTVQEF